MKLVEQWMAQGRMYRLLRDDAEIVLERMEHDRLGKPQWCDVYLWSARAYGTEPVSEAIWALTALIENLEADADTDDGAP